MGSGGNGEQLVKGYKLSIIGSEDLIYNIVTIVDNSVQYCLYNRNLLKSKLQQEIRT